MSRMIQLMFLAERQEPPGEGIPPGDPIAGVKEIVITIIAVSAFSIILATIFVAMRFAFRYTSKLRLLWDDWAIVVAMIFSNADSICYLVAIQYDFGQHICVISPSEIVNFFKIAFVTFFLPGVSVNFLKVSVLTFYSRIFPNNNFKRWLIALGVLSLIWWILITVLTFFQCVPLEKIWNPEISGLCSNYLNIFVAIQLLNIVLDIAIFILLISSVLKLRMSEANKISVAGIFAPGGLSVIFAITYLRRAILPSEPLGPHCGSRYHTL